MSASRLGLAQEAVRAGQKARIALTGPSGAGKTWTGLTVATVLANGGRVLLVDTEEGSGALYADDFKYQHLNWKPPYDPRELTALLTDPGLDYDVVIVDSLSHFWENEGGTLDIVDSVAARSSSKNTFAAWKEGTPIQQEMVRSFLRCGAHVIVTMRSKTEYVLEQDERGRTSPKRIGVTPVQRGGLEYEFTFLCNLELNHQLVVDKSRYKAVADKRYLAGKAGDFARAVAEWLNTAAPEEKMPPRAKDNEAGTVPPHHTSPANSEAPSPASPLAMDILYAMGEQVTPKQNKLQIDALVRRHGYDHILNRLETALKTSA